jgi:alpha-1,2-mannosyltransferase
VERAACCRTRAAACLVRLNRAHPIARFGFATFASAGRNHKGRPQGRCISATTVAATEPSTAIIISARKIGFIAPNPARELSFGKIIQSAVKPDMHSSTLDRRPPGLLLPSPASPGFVRAAAVLAALLLVAAYFVSPNFGDHFDPARGPYGGDFLQEWIGGHMVLTGQADRLYDLDEVRRLEHDPDLVGYRWNEGRHFPMVYPPFYYALVSPLAALPMKTAAVVWAGLMVACLIASVIWLPRASGDTSRHMACFIQLIALFTPLVENLTSNQKGSVLLLLLVATYALLRDRRPFAAGLVFGLLAFKPQLTLVIAAAMLLKRQWRFAAGGAVAGVTLVAASLAVSGQACQDYLAFSSQMADYLHTAGYDLAKSHSWYGFFHLLLQNQPDAVIRAASGAMILATLIIVGILLRGPMRVDSPQFAVQFSGLVLAAILVSPHLLTYDLTLLVLPATLAASWSLDRNAAKVSHVFVALLAAAVLISVSTPLARLIGVQISVPAMFAALIALTRRSVLPTPTQAANALRVRPTGECASDRPTGRRPSHS